jgi:uncharacterized protein YndB with AHSA1/START domain
MAVAELTLPVEPAEAWPYLREPALIRRWFGWEYEGLEHEIDVIFLQEAAVDDASRTLEWGDGIQEGDRLALEDLGVETGLRITRGAPEDGYDDIAEGWITFAQQLRFALEHGSDRDRRTLHLTGGPPGAADRAAALEGAEPWYRTAHQAGVLVDGGLLAVCEKPPAGTSAMTFTSFGDPPEESRWRAWWG